MPTQVTDVIIRRCAALRASLVPLMLALLLGSQARAQMSGRSSELTRTRRTC